MTNWKKRGNPFLNFTEELTHEWITKGFNREECKEWLDIGMGIEDSDYCRWLRDEIKIDPLYTLNIGWEEDLREQYQEYLKNDSRQLEISFWKRKYEKSLKVIKGLLAEKEAKLVKVSLELQNLNQKYKDLSKSKIKQLINWKEKEKLSEEIANCLEKINELNDDIRRIKKRISFLWLMDKNDTNKEARTELENKGVNAQEWLDKEYPKEERENIKKLDINCKSLKGKLILSNFPNLRRLNCCGNLLTGLDLSGCNPEKLTYLNISNNDFSKQDLSFLAPFVNLKHLKIGNDDKGRINRGIYNLFYGSLKHLQSFGDLKLLDIQNTDVKEGLEYLPNSLKIFLCEGEVRPKAKVNEICGELFIYGGNLKAWKEAHPELVTKAWGKEEKNEYLSSIPFATIPHKLLEKNKLGENYQIEETDYQRFIFEDSRPFSWTIEQDILLSFPMSPFKLYNIKTNKVEWTDVNSSIKKYAILSYVWGSMRDKSLLEDIKMIYQKGSKEYEKILVITKWGKKALFKTVKTLEFINRTVSEENKINYLWMDQLCIDQTSVEEQNQEVPKMGQYYGNAEVTLIPININLENEVMSKENKKESIIKTLKKIVISEWFSRSWTYQEGLLSHQTIFMFDDRLVDGRVMAQVWELIHWQNVSYGYRQLNEGPLTFTTPVGWTYSKKGCNLEKKTNLDLPSVLQVIKYRKRGIPIDGIYSILGLLPYGNKVKVNYKPRICPECPNREEIEGCQHKYENKKRAVYTKNELENALLEVMKEAIKEDYAEPLTWFGPRRNEPYLWWIPEVDENGSFNLSNTSPWMRSGLKCNSMNAEFKKNNLQLVGSVHVVESWKNDHSSDLLKESEFSYVSITSTNADFSQKYSWYKLDEFYLSGLKKTIELMRKGDRLVIPSGQKWKGNRALAILVPKEKNTHCSIDVVELRDESAEDELVFSFFSSNISQAKAKKILIDMVNKKVIEGEENIAQYEVQIQISSKK